MCEYCENTWYLATEGEYGDGFRVYIDVPPVGDNSGEPVLFIECERRGFKLDLTRELIINYCPICGRKLGGYDGNDTD